MFADSVKDLEAFRKEPNTTALATVVSLFKVFTARTRGSQSMEEEASGGQLASEFGTEDREEVIKKILLSGDNQGPHYEVVPADRFSSTNDSNGTRGTHAGR